MNSNLACLQLPYLHLLKAIMGACPGRPVVVTEFRHVSLRIATQPTTVDDLAHRTATALERLGFVDAVVVGHSFGTFVASRLCQLYKPVRGYQDFGWIWSGLGVTLMPSVGSCQGFLGNFVEGPRVWCVPAHFFRDAWLECWLYLLPCATLPPNWCLLDSTPVVECSIWCIFMSGLLRAVWAGLGTLMRPCVGTRATVRSLVCAS